MSWGPKEVISDFMRGQSVAALANIYGVNKFSVEELLREAVRSPLKWVPAPAPTQGKAPSPSPRPAQEAVRPVYGGGDDSLCDCPWRHDKGRALHAMGCPAVAGLEPNPMRSPRPGDTKEGK